MKTRFPIFSALGLVLLWAVMLVAIPLVMNLFKDFKVEMPTLTLAVLRASHLGQGLALPSLVCVVALLLALRQTAGWFLSIALCIAWDVAFLGLAMPIFLLINGLSGGDDVIVPAAIIAPALASAPSPFIALGGLVSNQVLLGLLLANRRTFFVR